MRTVTPEELKAIIENQDIEIELRNKGISRFGFMLPYSHRDAITEELSRVDMGIGLNVTAASFGCEAILELLGALSGDLARILHDSL